MKNKILVAGAILTTVATAGLVTATSVNAASDNSQTRQYGQQQSLEIKAKTLGVSVGELKGQNWKDVAKQKGIDEQKVVDALRASAQERWKARGLSDDEIKQRTADMEKRQASCDGDGQGESSGRNFGRGVHRQ